MLLKIIIVIACVILVYIIWQWQELKKFARTDYEIKSGKVQREYKAAVLADLHGFQYGKDNNRLLDAIRSGQPDLILIPGDMVVSRKSDTYETALKILEELCRIAPVYYSYGNHESRAHVRKSEYQEKFFAFEKKLKELGIHVLHNETEAFGELAVTGLEIPLSCYKKGVDVPLPQDYLEKTLPEQTEDTFQVLLAHNPRYAKEYADWGADLTFCGHNHGGLIRIPGVGSLISPQFQWFPKYDAGAFDFEGKKVIVSRGLGTHTFHIRIFNRAELVFMVIKPQDIA